MNSSRILAVIPARGGSKGVPRKNIRLLGGQPLITHTIETALKIRHLLYRVIVSTDDHEIMKISLELGVEVPFIRPTELSGDMVPMIEVLKHAVQFVEGQDNVQMDWVMLLQPTAPFRTVEDLERALELASSTEADSVISVVQVFSVHPILMKRIENDQLVPYCNEEKEGTRRQDYQPPAYMRNGAIYMTRRNTIMKSSSIWGRSIQPYVMPEERSVNIDSELDFKLAEIILAERQQP